MNNLFAKISVIKINHIGIVCSDLDISVKKWIKIPNAKLISGPKINSRQKTKYAFVNIGNSYMIELIMPTSKKSPVHNFIKSGYNLNHICYEVKDFDKAVEILEKEKSTKLVTGPIKDIAFNERRIVFFYSNSDGLFELVETKTSKNKYKNKPVEKLNNRIMTDNNILEVKKIIYKLFPKTKNLIDKSLKIGAVSKWDSLGHLNLIMEIEKKFNIKIPAEKISSIDGLSEIINLLSKKGK